MAWTGAGCCSCCGEEARRWRRPGPGSVAVAAPPPHTHLLIAPGLVAPRACRAWVQIVGEEATHGMSIACIGSTSARAAEKLGLQAVKYPEQPGVDTWAAVVEDCLRERQLLPAA